MIKTLAVETSCDDTSIGIVEYMDKKFLVKKLLAYSQIQDHQKYGGVVPEVASRLHSEKILPLINQIGLEEIGDVDFISVTTTPGLPGSLIVGISTANMLGNFLNKSIIDVNHIDGHIYSLFLERSIDDFQFPMIVLTASGGHNDLYYINLKDKKVFNFDVQKIGYSLDDACGECFDKVSRMLGGPYPGGRRISQKASEGNPNKNYRFSRIFLKSDEFLFSFSGMKSQVYYMLENMKKKGIELTDNLIKDICYEFQESIFEVLVNKIIKACKKYEAKSVGIAGGVSSNDRLYEYLNNTMTKKKLNDIALYKPVEKLYSTDNGAMIGVAGIIKYLQKIKI